MCRIIFNFFHFYYAEIHKKLWPKAPSLSGALGQMSKNVQVYFIHKHFFKEPNKKIYNRVKEFYCPATIFFFFDCLLSTCRKKRKLQNGPRLPTLPYRDVECWKKLFMKNRLFETYRDTNIEMGRPFGRWPLQTCRTRTNFRFESNYSASTSVRFPLEFGRKNKSQKRSGYSIRITFATRIFLYPST